MWNGLVPHLCVVDKNWEGYLRSEGSQAHSRPPTQDPVPGGEVVIIYGYKNQWGLRLWETETAGLPGSSS